MISPAGGSIWNGWRLQAGGKLVTVHRAQERASMAETLLLSV